MNLHGNDYHLSNNHSPRDSEMENLAGTLSSQDDFDALFINYAAMAWQEMRRAWRGDRSPASQRNCKTTQVMSWRTSYADPLSSKEPLDKPVPLSKVVKFLVEVWEQEL